VYISVKRELWAARRYSGDRWVSWRLWRQNSGI